MLCDDAPTVVLCKPSASNVLVARPVSVARALAVQDDGRDDALSLDGGAQLGEFRQGLDGVTSHLETSWLAVVRILLELTAVTEAGACSSHVLYGLVLPTRAVSFHARACIDSLRLFADPLGDLVLHIESERLAAGIGSDSSLTTRLSLDYLWASPDTPHLFREH